MAKYDLPAMVSYVLNVTNSSYLYYVGHSQGTMMGFIQFSEDPKWAAKNVCLNYFLFSVASITIFKAFF